MKRLVIYIVIYIISVWAVDARVWDRDILARGYEKTVIAMPDDYSGRVDATLVKSILNDSTDKAILYIHGYNDYFFQAEMGERFNSQGYNFYAVDLRKYGRSLLPHQRRFEVRDLKEYFADIDSALSVMKEDGNKEVILVGHSTGGFVSAYYVEKRSPEMVKAMILNSPFMDMNLSDALEKYALPVVTGIAKFFPNISIPQGSNDAYAQSLLRKYQGEWDYNTDWKMPLSPDVTSGWLRAITQAQKELQGGGSIAVPVLLMRSDKSVYGNEWSPEFNRGDAVLDVEEISRYGRMLGTRIQEVVIKEGLHDLLLSSKPVRDATYDYMFRWLKSNVK